MTRIAKITLPIVIILLGVTIAWQLMANSPTATRQAIIPQPPLVTYIESFPESLRIPVKTQGSVKPRTQIALSAQVAGRIVDVHPTFTGGGFFQKGDVLLRIDPRDFDLAIIKAEAVVAGAHQQLAQAEAEFKQKQEEYKNVERSKISDFALRKPRYEEARANLSAAKAELELAKLQRQRCDIRAPFHGRVVDKQVDVGQYVAPGTPLAGIYNIDIAEIKLPITQAQAQLLDLQLLNNVNTNTSPINAKLTATVSGERQTWHAGIMRTDAVIDERNQLLHLIAQVEDPFNMQGQQNSATLPIGIFVQADVEGRLLNDIYKLPRQALRNLNTVWLLDESLRLHVQTVDVMHRGEDNVYIKSGLHAGDKIIVSPLETVVEGMQLRIASAANDVAQPHQ